MTDENFNKFIKTWLALFATQPEDNIECTVNGKPTSAVEGLKKLEEIVSNTNTIENFKPAEVSEEPEETSSKPCVEENNSLFENLTDTVTKNKNQERYWITNYAVGCPLDTESEIRFAEKYEDDNVYAPGIREEDLLIILLHRNIDNPERKDAILKLLSTY